jgi:tetratricopeptide (TPR) repeat protein
MNPAMNNPTRSYEAAQRLAAEGKHRAAIEAYTTTIFCQPDHLKAICGRGLALQSLGQHQDAIEDFNRVLALDRTWVGAFVAFYSRALSRFSLGEVIAAIEDCTDALRLKPDYVEALYLRGLAFKAIERFDEALSDLQDVVGLDPQHVNAHHASGMLYFLQGDNDAAVTSFSLCIEIAIPPGTTTFESLRFRGIALQNVGRHAEAILDFDRAIEQSRDANIYFRRAASYEALGEMERSEEDLNCGKRILSQTHQ